MALIKCPECSTQVSNKAVSCPSCGCPIAVESEAHLGVPISQISAQTPLPLPTVTISKSRGVYIILGLLFGGMGFHNFYSGHNLRGAIKIGIFLIAFVIDASTRFYSAFSLVVLVIFVLWSLTEVITVENDASGNAMS